LKIIVAFGMIGLRRFEEFWGLDSIWGEALWRDSLSIDSLPLAENW
jgi:hypothetical protein